MIPRLYYTMNDQFEKFYSQSQFISLTLDICSDHRLGSFFATTGMISTTVMLSSLTYQNLASYAFTFTRKLYHESFAANQYQGIRKFDTEYDDEPCAPTTGGNYSNMFGPIKHSFDNVTLHNVSLRIPCFAHSSTGS
ncbi:unnamed protein product [Adineta ricciae]|uniref:Uncharacterized protein n=1 Tax=Adineta ricciae TaxID=249248 RepID=A0A814NMF9_ADIRI|nr:unnamed protein product [Adineta ricciae]CAF1518094.1 unnamed protein product [Adineta ricciae]